MDVRFYETVEDSLLEYAVIITRFQEKWVFCKHKTRSTYEVPGGHREPGETILEAARRELHEETGALAFEIRPVCVYSVLRGGEETYGMLYSAEVTDFERELHSEIERIELFDKLPERWTYPQIQPLLIQEYERRNTEGSQ